MNRLLLLSSALFAGTVYGQASDSLAGVAANQNIAHSIVNVESASCNVRIYDLNGRLVLREDNVGEDLQLHQSSLSSGFYVFVLEQQTGVVSTGKFYVQ